jgi:hypothetical protein
MGSILTYSIFDSSLAGSDFVEVDTTVVFPPWSADDSRMCFNVTILDDSNFQKERSFSLEIGDVEDNVRLLVSSLEVTVHDDDSELRGA